MSIRYRSITSVLVWLSYELCYSVNPPPVFKYHPVTKYIFSPDPCLFKSPTMHCATLCIHLIITAETQR